MAFQIIYYDFSDLKVYIILLISSDKFVHMLLMDVVIFVDFLSEACRMEGVSTPLAKLMDVDKPRPPPPDVFHPTPTLKRVYTPLVHPRK